MNVKSENVLTAFIGSGLEEDEKLPPKRDIIYKNCKDILLPWWTIFNKLTKDIYNFYIIVPLRNKQKPGQNTARDAEYFSNWSVKFFTLNLLCSGRRNQT